MVIDGSIGFSSSFDPIEASRGGIIMSGHEAITAAFAEVCSGIASQPTPTLDLARVNH
jgi:hypothetical protein